MQTITSTQIDGQLSSLASMLVELDAEAKKLAFGAVSGDKTAVAAFG